MAATPDVLAFLRRRELFAELTEAGLARLADAARPLTLVPGQILFCQDETADAAYVIREGTIAVGTVDGSGREVHFADLQAGAVFGEVGLIDGGPRTATATAATRASLLRLPGFVFLDVARTEWGFALALMRDLVAKLRAADTYIEDKSALLLPARLAKFLLAADGPIRLTQAQIAERMGTSREAVNRQLRAFEVEGTVELGRGRVLVTDAERLSNRLGSC
ncbi:Crp/Fnr family transcriptional regulator [Parvularcula dongshanensis]|uniref:CRP-like cAMP-binding protein n=1 Tax=Parvularcula dongshanensis TaxID=1173995 RepID=A0A840I1I9_9PROT|nr:Crp/Fnr family transcriptional regulator [Parvularcula dongshanensis]MBB4658151.1 CRP-like cAMP-binding protein [Parvularcula dongshanensis]